MQIPRLPATGENLKKYLMDTIKAILNYLYASRVRPGFGIDVKETPSGTIISLAGKPSGAVSSQTLSGYTGPFAASLVSYDGDTYAVVSISSGFVFIEPEKIEINKKTVSTGTIQTVGGDIVYLHAHKVSPGNVTFEFTVTIGLNTDTDFYIPIAYDYGGGLIQQIQYGNIVYTPWDSDSGIQDLTASVSGGTAFLGLSGSTSSVEFVGTGDVTLSGNTNGQIEIDVQGGTGGATGFPDFSASSPDFINVTNGSVTKTYNYPIWLIGNATKNTASDMSGNVKLSFGSTYNFDLLDIGIGSTTLYGFSVPVCIPIPANTTFSLTSTSMTSFNGYAFPTT